MKVDTLMCRDDWDLRLEFAQEWNISISTCIWHLSNASHETWDWDVKKAIGHWNGIQLTAHCSLMKFWFMRFTKSADPGWCKGERIKDYSLQVFACTTTTTKVDDLGTGPTLLGRPQGQQPLNQMLSCGPCATWESSRVRELQDDIWATVEQ